MNTTLQPHSAEYFGDYRDYWWNKDYLKLIVDRLQIGQVKTVLDVGCGIGHWGSLLLDVLPQAHITGLDQEAKWVEKAKARAGNDGHGDRSSFVNGPAEAIPFPNSTFDLVTCQTLLIHVKGPQAVIREMVRVLKPNGRILVAEPNNLTGALVSSNPRPKLPDVLDLVKFQAICELGKEKLGLGNNSVGDHVPGYFAELGLQQIKVSLSDKANPLFPPYSSKEQQVSIEQIQEWSSRGFWIWDKAETQRYFVAGNDSDDQFKFFWNKAMANLAEIHTAIQEKTYHSAGGNMMYLISGIKTQ